MELNVTHRQLLVCAADIMLSENINTIKNTEAALETIREIDLEVNTEKVSISLCLVTKKCRTKL